MTDGRATSGTRPALAWGAVLVGIYLAAGALTVGATGRVARPLFDGFGPPPRYQWVAPPKAFAAGNKAPRPSREDLALDAGGSRRDGVTSTDGQLVLDLPAGAVPPAAPGATASVAITPLDAATLGPLPDGRMPDGNAYRVDVDAGQPPQPGQTLGRAGLGPAHRPPSGRHRLLVLGRAVLGAGRELSRRQHPRLHPPDRRGYYLASAAPVGDTVAPRSTGDIPRTLAVAGATVVLPWAPSWRRLCCAGSGDGRSRRDRDTTGATPSARTGRGMGRRRRGAAPASAHTLTWCATWAWRSRPPVRWSPFSPRWWSAACCRSWPGASARGRRPGCRRVASRRPRRRRRGPFRRPLLRQRRRRPPAVAGPAGVLDDLRPGRGGRDTRTRRGPGRRRGDRRPPEQGGDTGVR